MTALDTLKGSGPLRPVSGVSFQAADLVSAIITNAWTKKCSFVGADLRQATLDGSYFAQCDLRRANLQGASLRGVTFAACDLRETDLRGCDLTGARFTYMNTGSPNGSTDISGALFGGAQLRDAMFERVIGKLPE